MNKPDQEAVLAITAYVQAVEAHAQLSECDGSLACLHAEKRINEAMEYAASALRAAILHHASQLPGGVGGNAANR